MDDNRITLRCQACGDAGGCNLYCELTVEKSTVVVEELLCPVSGEEAEWFEVKKLTNDIEECPHCCEIVPEGGVLSCPSCGREGCFHCIPAGNGCDCPECEEGE